jgi:Tol biopolymer transport system component
MSTATSSSLPVVDPLIAEARRRARLRRALIVASAAVVALAVFLAVRLVGASTAAAGSLLPGTNGQLTIIHGGIRTVGASSLGQVIWRCGGPIHKCWEVESLSWSPDGHRFAFGGVSIGGAGIYDGLHVVDLRNGSTAIIRPLKATERDWLDLAWAPDGRRLAFVSNWTIFILNDDGTGFRELDTGTAGHDRAPTWSRDGNRLAYEVDGGRSSSVYTIDVDGAHRNVVARNAGWPAWSPDGSTIAYRACGGIRFATPAGRDVTPSSASGCAHVGVDGAPVWSPDGRKIAIGVAFGTYVMNADGSGLAKVGPPPDNGAQPQVRNAWLRPSGRAKPQG